jgi:iron complex outermembrane receptor protein
MKKFTAKHLALAVAAQAALAGGMVNVANAEENLMMEEVITVGTRGKPRSATDSPAPVDVIGVDAFANQGGADLSDLIRNVVPSYNVNDQPISDAATLVRPANLRGLAPDHTLLLVNGKRRHRASVITWLGNGISNGSQGPDMAAIPSIAIKSLEILRDGAAAQYGSDAIAGVMNFVLKDDAEGGSVEVRYGEFGEGDGQKVYVAGNLGMPFGENGFINLSVEAGQQDPTSRSTQRDDAAGLIADGYTGVPDPAMIWGLPIVEDDNKFFVNFATEIGDGMELYGHGNYNTKHVDGGFFYRNPVNRGAVYSNDGGATMLVGDLTPNDGVACPTVAFSGNTPDPVAWAAVQADPNCFAWQERIPGGFTPRFGGDVTDTSFLVGVRGGEEGGLTWDLSAYMGSNEADFFINNTINASLPDSPRDFNPGGYKQEDTSINADFAYVVSDDFNLGFGAESRVEEFTIMPGQVESYTAGPLAEQGFSTSSNGFPGFPAVTSGTWDRANTAVYVDAEFQMSADLLVQAAVRFEDYDDFGTTTNFKTGFNYQVSDSAGFRGTISTGFKAPTPGQANASNTSTELTGGVLVNNGTIPAAFAALVEPSAKELGPEESTNFTIGTFFTIADSIDVTMDYFNIEVNDRLNLASEVSLSPEQKQILIDANVPGAGDMNRFRYFTNDFDTTTEGVDIVASTSTEMGSGTTTWSLAYNYTKTTVDSYNPDTINEYRIRQIEETTPDTRWNISANHDMGDMRMLARVSYYDDWFDSFEADVFGTDAVFDGVFTFDVEGEYTINENASVLVGVQNLSDERGQTTTEVNNLGFDTSTVLGNQYSQYAPMGFSGRFMYGRFRYTF